MKFSTDNTRMHPIGMSISLAYDYYQNLIDALEEVEKASDNLGLWVNGLPFAQTCKRVLGEIQRQESKRKKKSRLRDTDERRADGSSDPRQA